MANQPLIQQINKQGIVSEKRSTEEGASSISDPEKVLGAVGFAEGDGVDTLSVRANSSSISGHQIR